MYRLGILAAFIFCVLTSPLACEENLGVKRVALVIGNSNYLNTRPLINPTNDAHDIAAKLRGLGFQVIDKYDIDKDRWDTALEDFAKLVPDADAALFFYAGHGMQHDGRNYLLPIDAELKGRHSLSYELVEVDRVRKVLDRARKAVRIVILDACRNNPLADSFVRTISGDTRALAETRGFTRIEGAQGLVVAYSTQADDVAQDGENERNSPFSGALLTRLDEPGLEIGSLFRRVVGDVQQKTKGRQTPELSISLAGDFYLNTSETDRAYWERIRDSDNPKNFSDFINRFPASFLVPDAQYRMKILNNAIIVRRREEEEKNKVAKAEAERHELEVLRQEAERKRMEAEKAEADRLKQEAAILAQQRKQAEVEKTKTAEMEARLEAQRQEAERKRLEAEKAEADRLKREAALQEQQRKQAEAERAKAAEIERQRLETQRQDAERKRLEAEKAEADRLKREAALLQEQQRKQAEAEKAKIAQAEAAHQKEEALRRKEEERLRIVEEKAEAIQLKQEAELKEKDRKKAEAEKAKADEAERKRLESLRQDEEVKRIAAEKAEADRVTQEAKLQETEEPKASLTDFDTPELVKKAQKILKRLGCYEGAETGDVDKLTTDAVKNYFVHTNERNQGTQVTALFVDELKYHHKRVCPPISCAKGMEIKGMICVARVTPPEEKIAPRAKREPEHGPERATRPKTTKVVRIQSSLSPRPHSIPEVRPAQVATPVAARKPSSSLGGAGF